MVPPSSPVPLTHVTKGCLELKQWGGDGQMENSEEDEDYDFIQVHEKGLNTSQNTVPTPIVSFPTKVPLTNRE